METVAIHEFSTGINVEILEDDRWRSKGFNVGGYMNSTLPKIPYAVERAIANKFFKVSKDRNSQEPTFVGNVVLSDQKPDWSVVAVATSGQDEYNRSTSFYRYFLCEGADSLWKILDWLDYYQQEYGQWPVFNPVKTKVSGQPNQHSFSTPPRCELITPKFQDWLSKEPVPIIIQPGQQYTLQMIDQMAEMKAIGQPVSWAYNVEAVEQPELFVIIQAASKQSYQQLIQMRGELITNSRAILASSVDGAALKAAINGLVSGSQVRQQWIQTIVDTLQDGRVTKEYWKTIFDDLGAANALRQGSSLPQMVRLLTLRAIVLPETLPEFLNWLKLEGNKAKTTTEQTTSLQFQEQLKTYNSQLIPFLNNGINITLAKLLKGDISVASVVWLLTAQKGLWTIYSPFLIKNIFTDLEVIRTIPATRQRQLTPDSFKCGEFIWKGLQAYLSNRLPQKAYKYFAELFKELNEYKLSAYFYEVSDGEVPKNIWKSALLDTSGTDTLLGITVHREVIFIDYLSDFIKKYGLPIAIAALLIATHTGAFFIGNYSSLSSNNNVRQQFKKITQPALDDIVQDLSKDSKLIAQFDSANIQPEKRGEEVRKALKNVLGDYKLNYTKLDEKPEEMYRWYLAIFAYQRNILKNSSPNGILDQNTFQKLQEDVKQKIKPNSSRKTDTQSTVEIENEQFKKRTKPALDKIIQDLQSDPDLTTQFQLAETGQDNVPINDITKAMKNVLKNPNLDYANLDENSAQINMWVKAIYNYQTRFGQRDGIIDEGGTTFNQLKNDVKTKLLTNSQNYQGTQE